MKELRGVTSFRLRKELREVMSKMPALWTRSYFASTAGDVSTETIERYIEAQKGCSMYQVRRVHIGKTDQLDELARECGKLYSQTVIFF